MQQKRFKFPVASLKFSKKFVKFPPSGLSFQRFTCNTHTHVQVLHINVCLFMYVCVCLFQYFFGLLLQLISNRVCVSIELCAAFSKFVFCSVVQIRSYLHIGLFDLGCEISLPISEYQV